MRRWMTFNGVGLLGFGVQLGVLAALLEVPGWHPLAATAAGVEAAILHNFAWHQRVTWRDRRARGLQGSMERLWRFHLLNGFVSLAGNLAIVAALTGAGRVHPVAANVAAVLACSIVNFFGSDRLVFRASGLVTAFVLLPVVAGAEPTAEDALVSQLRPPTVAAWQQYEKLIDARYEAAGASDTPFFAHDAFGRERAWRRQVLSGAVEMFQAERASPGHAGIDVPDGRIHHWVGAMFVPDATVEGVLRTLQARAGRESESYDEVIASKLLARDGPRLRVYMKIERDATITTVTYNTEHEVVYRTLGAARAASRSAATRIAEVVDAGEPGEREKPPGNDSGYLWRLNAYWRYEEVPGGVIVECESVSLSRGVPFMLRPLVTPIANRLARESLRSTLTTLRGVLTAGARASGRP